MRRMRITPIARRRLLWLLGCVLLISALAAGVYAYTQRSLRRQYADEKTRAFAAARVGDARNAINLLTHYLRRYPDDTEALATFADFRPLLDPDSSETRQQTASALKHLLQLQPERDEWRRRLLALYVASGADDEALRIAEGLLARHPADVPALRQTASIRARRAEWTTSFALAEKWMKAAPLDLDARLLYLQGCKATGIALGEIVHRAATWRREHPDDPRFELLEAVALNVTGMPREPIGSTTAPVDPRGPAEWLRLAATRVAPDAEFTVLLVREMERVGLFADALAILRRDLAASGSHDLSLLARRLWESGNWQELIARAGVNRTTIEKLETTAVGYLGLSLHALGRDGEIDSLRLVLAARTNDPAASCWLAVWDQMIGLKPVDPTGLARMCRAALERDSDAVLFRFLLADSLARRDEPELAIEELRRVVNDDLTWTAPPARLAELLLETGNLTAAVEVANEARRRAAAGIAPGSLRVATVLVRVWFAALENGLADRPGELIMLADSVQRELPGEPYSLHVAVALKTRAGDRPGAAALLAKAIDRPDPVDEATLLQYVSISREYELGVEEAAFVRSQRDHGATPALVFARAVMRWGAGDAPAGRRIIDEAKQSAAPSITWDLIEARYLDLSRDPAAAAAWAKLADAVPGDIDVQRAALDSTVAANDRAFADRVIGRLQKLEGDAGIGWRLARARWRFLTPDPARLDYEESARLATQVLARCPNCAQAHWLLGRSLRRLGNDVAALDRLDSAATLNPASPQLQLDLARILIDRGLSARARMVLDRLPLLPNPSAILLARIAYLNELNNASAEAERLYRRALAIDPHLVPAQNNLAMILARKGVPAAVREAVDWAFKATQAWPEVAAVYDTLAFAQWKTGQPETALKTLNAAIALPNHDRASEVRRVTFLLDAGQLTEARAALSAIDLTAPERLSPELQAELRQARDRLAVRPATRGRAN